MDAFEPTGLYCVRAKCAETEWPVCKQTATRINIRTGMVRLHDGIHFRPPPYEWCSFHTLLNPITQSAAFHKIMHPITVTSSCLLRVISDVSLLSEQNSCTNHPVLLLPSSPSEPIVLEHILYQKSSFF